MSKPLTAKQASFVQYYADPGSDTYNNATASMILAGYDKRYANHHCNRLVVHGGVKTAINGYKAKTTAKLDHNRTIAIDQLNHNIALLDGILDRQPDNVTAITARSAAIRELNAISNLHSSTVNTGNKALSITVAKRESLPHVHPKAITGAGSGQGQAQEIIDSTATQEPGQGGGGD